MLPIKVLLSKSLLPCDSRDQFRFVFRPILCSRSNSPLRSPGWIRRKSPGAYDSRNLRQMLGIKFVNGWHKAGDRRLRIGTAGFHPVYQRKKLTIAHRRGTKHWTYDRQIRLWTMLCQLVQTMGQFRPGVEIHANLVDGILAGW